MYSLQRCVAIGGGLHYRNQIDMQVQKNKFTVYEQPYSLVQVIYMLMIILGTPSIASKARGHTLIFVAVGSLPRCACESEGAPNRVGIHGVNLCNGSNTTSFLLDVSRARCSAAARNDELQVQA